MESITPKPKAKKRHVWRWAGLSIGVIILAYAAFAVSVLMNYWQGTKTEKITAYVPIPVAWLGWRPLFAHDYISQTRAIHQYDAFMATTNPQAAPTPNIMEERAASLSKQLRDLQTNQIIHELGITVTPADIDQAYTSQVLQSGDQQQVAQAIKEYYGWTPEQFKYYVLSGVVARDKLREKLSFDDSLNAVQRQQADRVMAIVKEGKQSFADIAKAYSEDIYGPEGGDMGFISRGEQDKEIEDVAFALEKNKVSEIVHTKYGFHILKVLDKKTVSGQEQVQLAEIYIGAPDVDQYVSQIMTKRRVLVWMKGLDWNRQDTQVVSPDVVATVDNSTVTNNSPVTNDSPAANTNSSTTE